MAQGGALTVRGITSDNANITIQGVNSPQATFDGAVKIGETGNGSLSIVTGAVTVTSTGVALEVGSGTVSSLLGTLSVTGNTLIGDRGGQTGSFSVSSATLSGALTLGENGGIGNATISGGTLQVSGATILGQAAGDTGTLTATRRWHQCRSKRNIDNRKRGRWNANSWRKRKSERAQRNSGVRHRKQRRG